MLYDDAIIISWGIVVIKSVIVWTVSANTTVTVWDIIITEIIVIGGYQKDTIIFVQICIVVTQYVINRGLQKYAIILVRKNVITIN